MSLLPLQREKAGQTKSVTLLGRIRELSAGQTAALKSGESPGAEATGATAGRDTDAMWEAEHGLAWE